MERCQQKNLKFIGCEIIYREACYLAATGPHKVDVEFLRKGLHDLETADMVTRLQSSVDATDAEEGYEAVLLGYARCNDGLVGLTARDIPLVIPRAHDCVTFFFGSRESYREYFDASPGTYYMTSGWSERNTSGKDDRGQPAYGQQGVMGKLGLTASHAEMVAKYGQDNAAFIAEFLGGWQANYSRCLYLKMGICDEEPFIATARRQAEERHWEFEIRQGRLTLLEKLFHGEWDDNFVVVPPGRKIAARNDEQVLDVSD